MFLTNDISLVKTFLINYSKKYKHTKKINKIKNYTNIFSYLIKHFHIIFPLYKLKHCKQSQKRFKRIYKQNLSLQKEINQIITELEKKTDKFSFDIFLLNESLNILQQYIFMCKDYYTQIQLIIYQKANYNMDICRHILSFV